MIMGTNVNEEGKLIPAVKAKTLDEVDRRASKLKSQEDNIWLFSTYILKS